jgi:hypothetical protein
MDVRCVGYPAYIFAPGCARIAPGDKTALLATYVISATRFPVGPKLTSSAFRSTSGKTNFGSRRLVRDK